MKIMRNRPLWTCLIAVAAVLSWNTYLSVSQDDARALDDGYMVLSGSDIRFRVEGKKGDAILGRFVVRVDGKWRDIDVPAAANALSAR